MPISKPTVQITAAFGNRECPKVVELLDHSEQAVRVQALHVLGDLFKTPKAISNCLEAGVIKRLAQMVLDIDVTTRQRAAHAMGILAADANGKRFMLRSGASDTMYPALNDDDVEVRRKVYETLITFSATLEGVEDLCKADYTELLVQKSGAEDDRIKPLTLQLLYNVLRQPNGESLRLAQKCGAINTSTDLLKSGSPLVREKAALTLTALTLTDAGKQFAIKAETLTFLVPLLKDSNWKVRANAAGGIMSICIDDEGKNLALGHKAPEFLMGMLRDPERFVRLNAVKAISAVCPHPEARKRFQEGKGCIAALTVMVDDTSDELLSRSARIARDTVQWEP
jgi:hypothetical protein